MPNRDLSHLSREELETEIRRLRTKMRSTSMDKARQNAVFDSALDFAIVVTDREGTITAWNSGAEHVTGWDAEEMCGQNAARLFTPDDRAAGRIAYEMDVALRDGRASDERWHLKKGEERFWASGEMMPLRDEDEAHIGFVKIMRDRTAEHLSGLALADAERQLRRAQEVGGVGLFSVDLASNQLRPTPEFCRLYGLAVQDSYPATAIEACIIPEDKHLVSTAEIRARGEHIPDVEYRIRRADTGELRWINRKGEIERDENDHAPRFTGIARDVTTQREAAAEFAAREERFRIDLEQQVADRSAELMRAEELLRQSQKMEAVGQLTGGLAHDFNNLLSGIIGALELMGLRIGQGRLKDIDKYMVAAQGAAKRAAALTHRLLAFSRQQTLEPKPTNVNSLVNGMLDLIQRTVGPSIPVTVVDVADLWPTLVDPSQLENALLNLCINARDAMPDGGRITIETANRTIDQQAGMRQDMPPGQYLSLCVSDTGAGMPPEVIARAFDPFFTTKPIGQGTGLGLSMIYGFAKQSGGQVRIHSIVDQGTTVCIYLPRHQGEAQESETSSSPGLVPLVEAGETVLVVDDEPTVRMLLTEVLEELGYTAIEAADSAGGLRVLQSDTRLDLLITDVGLPGGMNGRQMADAGRERRPGLKVLFITGYAENALLSNGQLETGMAVLTKPFAMDALTARIRELVAR